MAKEILGPRLTTYHNLAFYHRLMTNIRAALRTGTFLAYRESFLAMYQSEASVSADDPPSEHREGSDRDRSG